MSRFVFVLERSINGQPNYYKEGGPTTDIHQAQQWATHDSAIMFKSVGQLFAYEVKEHGFEDGSANPESSAQTDLAETVEVPAPQLAFESGVPAATETAPISTEADLTELAPAEADLEKAESSVEKAEGVTLDDSSDQSTDSEGDKL